MIFHSSEQSISSLSHIEGTTLGAGQEIYEVAGKASDIGLDGISEVGDRASEEQLLGCMEQVLQWGLYQG